MTISRLRAVRSGRTFTPGYSSPAAHSRGTPLSVMPLAKTSTRPLPGTSSTAGAAASAALRTAQQAMSRKMKFSSNWKKAKARTQRIHSRIGDARRDYLHKCSTTISKNHAIVCIEDLQARNMSKSAAGTTDQPGKNVRAKSGLNKSILDQGLVRANW